MLWLNVVIALMAVVDIALGAEAALIKGSGWSLVGGGLAGLLLIASLVFLKQKPRLWRTLALIVNLAVAGRFMPKLIKEQQVYPAGVLASLSLLTAACLIGAHFYAVLRKRNQETQA